MKKIGINNQRRAAALAVMVILVLGLHFLTREKSGTTINRDLFKPSNTERISRVTFRSSRGQVELAFENNRWRVDGKWEADPSMVTVLFATLRSTEARRLVAATQADSVAKWLRDEGTEVTLFEGENATMKFFAGGDRQSNVTWYALATADSQPYEVIIPGYRVFVAGILELDEGGWRNKRVFDFNWRNFKSLKASYRNEAGFEVELRGRYFGIREMEPTDTAKLNTYLDAVSLLMAKRFVNASAVTDSLSRLAPAITIEVTDVASRSYKLDLFTPAKNDPEVWGRNGAGEWLRLDRRDVGQLAWRRDYFAVKGQPER